MFMPVPTAQHLRIEPAPVAAVGSVLAEFFADIPREPPPSKMEELLRSVGRPQEPDGYWRRFYQADVQ